ncbi:MAG: hypothetical protein EOO13_11680 [Chitinophagaceae bacterium]|nr:MAG: hypothetical protein EOO13_11680 [Chitinophagaceae bacterium]
MDFQLILHLLNKKHCKNISSPLKFTKMKSENILQSDLLDIVFDNRNKAYGAYELRRHYKRRLVKALSVAFILAGGLACIALFIKKEKGLKMSIADTEYVFFKEVDMPKEKPVEIKKPEPKKAQAAAEKKVAQQQYVSNIEITKNPAEASKINTLKEDVAISGQNVEGKPEGQVFVPDPIKIDASGNDIPTAPAVDKLTPRATADIMPAYPGGMNALRKFMEKNLQSFDDIDEGKVVSVKITFVVGFDGKLKGFQVMEDGGAPYNNEVIRVLKKMPEWIPGKANGENVSVYYTIPVKFTAAQ